MWLIYWIYNNLRALVLVFYIILGILMISSVFVSVYIGKTVGVVLLLVSVIFSLLSLLLVLYTVHMVNRDKLKRN